MCSAKIFPRVALDKLSFAGSLFAGGSLPRAALGKTFAERVCPFVERSKLSVKDWNPVVIGQN
jgi:hypothetical protein